MLRSAGARPPQLDPVDAFAAAAMLDDRPSVERLPADDPSLRVRAMTRHPGLMVRAAALGRRPTVRLLVELGFDVNSRHRRTALHEAAWRDDAPMVELLLELGADPAITDTDHQATPLGWAQHGGRSNVAAPLGQEERIER